MTYDQMLDPDIILGNISLSSRAYSTERLSALVDASFVKKGTYDIDTVPHLSLELAAPLSVIRLSKEDYLNSDMQKNDDAIYLVETDSLDAFGCVVSNVGDPTNNNDVANKKYVDDAFDGKYASVITSEDGASTYSGVILNDTVRDGDKYLLTVRRGKITLSKVQ